MSSSQNVSTQSKGTMGKVVALWKSGKMGKGVIIGVVVVILAIIGSFVDDEKMEKIEASAANETVKDSSEKAKPENKKDEFEVDKNLLKGSSMDTAKPNNDLVLVKKGRSIMTEALDASKWNKEYEEVRRKYRDTMGLPVVQRNELERLYKSDFFSPVTHEQAKIDPTKPRFTLFGGTLKMGDVFDIPADANLDGCWFNAKYNGVGVRFDLDTTLTGFCDGKGGFNTGKRMLADGSQVWTSNYEVKEFMGLKTAKMYWYRAKDSNKFELFYAEIMNRDAGNSKDARETRERLAAAIQSKYPDMKKTFHDKITDEYMLNGDILELMQSAVPKEGGFFDAPYVKVALISPSVVAKLLGVIDGMIKDEFESYKQKDKGALDNF